MQFNPGCILLTVAAALAQFVLVCRAHWLDLELAFSGWRKVAAVNRPSRLSQQQQDAQFLQRRNKGAAACVIVCVDDAGDNLVTDGSIPADANACSKAPAVSAAALMRDGRTQKLACQTSIEVAAAAATGNDLSQLQQLEQSDLQQALQQQQEGDITDEQQQQQEQVVHVSLADYPVGMPWRPLEVRAGVMAQRGLQRLTGARLAKAVRDLRELEGPYIVKDNKRYAHEFGQQGISNALGWCGTPTPRSLLTKARGWDV
jgi:hypothetical protein